MPHLSASRATASASSIIENAIDTNTKGATSMRLWPFRVATAAASAASRASAVMSYQTNNHDDNDDDDEDSDDSVRHYSSFQITSLSG